MDQDFLLSKRVDSDEKLNELVFLFGLVDSFLNVLIKLIESFWFGWKAEFRMEEGRIKVEKVDWDWAVFELLVSFRVWVQVGILPKDLPVEAHIPGVEHIAHVPFEEDHNPAGAMVRIIHGNCDIQLARERNGMLLIEFQLFLGIWVESY